MIFSIIIMIEFFSYDNHSKYSTIFFSSYFHLTIKATNLGYNASILSKLLSPLSGILIVEILTIFFI